MVIYVCLEGKVNIFVIEGWEEKLLFAIHGLKAWFEIYGFRLGVLCPGFKAQGPRSKFQDPKSMVQDPGPGPRAQGPWFRIQGFRDLKFMLLFSWGKGRVMVRVRVR